MHYQNNMRVLLLTVIIPKTGIGQNGFLLYVPDCFIFFPKSVFGVGIFSDFAYFYLPTGKTDCFIRTVSQVLEIERCMYKLYCFLTNVV